MDTIQTLNKNKIMEKDKRNLIITAICHTQLQLEVMDELKNLPYYRHATKRNINILERDLEKILSDDIGQGYIDDERSFAYLAEHIQKIAKWVGKAEFRDIIDLGRALENGNIKFED